MSEWTPTIGEIRFRVERDWEPYGDGAFDRWLAAHEAAHAEFVRAQVAAEIEAEYDRRRKILGHLSVGYHEGFLDALDAATTIAHTPKEPDHA